LTRMVCGTVLTYSKVGTFNLNTVRENNESFTMADTKRPGTYEHWYPTIALPFPFKNKLFSPDISSSLGHNLIFFGFRNLITGGLKKYTHLRNRFGQDNYLKSFLVDAFTLGVIGTTSAYYYFEPQRTKNEILWETAFGVSSAYIATQSVFQLGSIGYNKACILTLPLED